MSPKRKTAITSSSRDPVHEFKKGINEIQLP